MYACLYVCMYVCMYVCVYVCMYVVWIYLDGRFDYGASGVCTRHMRRYGTVWLVCSVRLLDECMSWLLGVEWNKQVNNKYIFTARLLGC